MQELISFKNLTLILITVWLSIFIGYFIKIKQFPIILIISISIYISFYIVLLISKIFMKPKYVITFFGKPILKIEDNEIVWYKDGKKIKVTDDLLPISLLDLLIQLSGNRLDFTNVSPENREKYFKFIAKINEEDKNKEKLLEKLNKLLDTDHIQLLKEEHLIIDKTQDEVFIRLHLDKDKNGEYII